MMGGYLDRRSVRRTAVRSESASLLRAEERALDAAGVAAPARRAATSLASKDSSSASPSALPAMDETSRAAGVVRWTIGRRVMGQLREARRRYQELFEQSLDACLVTDARGCIEEANQAASSLLHGDGRRLVGQSIFRFFGAEQRGLLKRWMRDLRHDPRSVDVEIDAIPAAGGPIVVELRLGAVGEAETGISFRWTMRDASARRRAEEQVRTMNAELERRIRERTRELSRVNGEIHALLSREQEARAAAEAANRMKDDFLAMVSHELRTPLHAVLGWTRLLRHDDVTADERAFAVEVIERNALQQSKLISDLLDVSRIVAGNLELSNEPLDFRQVVFDALDDVVPLARAKNIDLEAPKASRGGGGEDGPLSAAEAAPIVVIGDRERLEQVVTNLLSNAIKFTPEGGRVSLSLRTVRSNREAGTSGSVLLQVEDTGRGIAPAFLPHVFERFRQSGPRAGRHGGLGLGLTIVKHLVELHGGTVRAASAGEGRGATMTVELPTHA
jgi:PAS domain S-box-containing protein